MSGPTRTEFAAMNDELQETNRKLEKMNLEAMALTRRARNDTDEVELAAAHYRTQRDRLVGFLQGYRKDIEESIEVDPVDRLAISPRISRVDAFLGECREDPPIRDGVSRPLR